MGSTKEKGEINREEFEKCKECLKHLKEQFHVRYKYLIGEWQGDIRARSTDTGEFVSLNTVQRYIDNHKKRRVYE